LPQFISSAAANQEAAREAAEEALRPLCVDLDGTLVKSDTLVDSLLAMARQNPSLIFKLPAQLLKGKAAFKAFVAEQVSLDVVHLPYNEALLEFLRQERESGRAIYLVTGADIRLARRVADHLGIFTDVLASDGVTNLTGSNKLAALHRRLNSTAFDYVGNDIPDLPLLSAASQPMVANPTLRLRMKLGALKPGRAFPGQNFMDRQPTIKSILRSLRLHQWAKNLLIFVPLLCSHALSRDKLLTALAAFCCFCLTASSAYLFNDLLDIEADRRHSHKHRRPFASGDLSAFSGILLAVVLLTAGLAGAAMLPGRFPGGFLGGFSVWLLIYLATTVAYSIYLKRIPLVDVMVLSGLYILRLLAGGAATQTPISHWLAGFSMFLFLSLAIVKRFAELESLRVSNGVPRNGRGYLLADLDQLRSFGTSSAYAAVVVFAIYISSSDVVRLYNHPRFLWLTVPLIILWLNRVWLLASRGQLDEDPVAFALTDRMSQVIGATVLVVALLAL
jgi:4-hydroxybenzoate polyprenyltransferase/phosphoserine phosphatase